MIYLVHGQNEVDSRRFLTKLKVSYGDVREVDGKNLTKEYLERQLSESSVSLFGAKSAFLIDNFSSGLDILPKQSPEGLDLIVWSSKKIPVYSKHLKSFLFDKVVKANVFKLTDAVLSGRERQALILLDELVQSKEAPEKIIGTLNRGLCFLYFAKEGSIAKTNLPPFIQQKHVEQARGWDEKTVKKGMAKLISADLAIKSGSKPHLVLTNLISELASWPTTE